MELSEAERIDLIESACEAEERFDIDDLEEFAKMKQNEVDLISKEEFH